VAPVPGFGGAGANADFACAYAVTVAPDDGRSAEEWARTAWEGAPSAQRWFILAGWRLVLGLQLGPRPSPDHILGWRMVDTRPEEVVCHARSWFLGADNIFHRADDRLVWSTFVTYERLVARALWPPVSIVHRLVVRRALRRSASRAPTLTHGYS
jgi:hypothetical protein